MTTIDRRAFVGGSLSVVADFAGSRRGKAAPSDKVIIGVMGTGGRGTYLATAFARRADAEVACVCDAGARRASKAKAAVAGAP